MKKQSFQTILIPALSLIFTATTCIKTIIKNLFGTLSRSWCDQELQRWSHKMLNLLKIQNTIFNPNNVAPKLHQPTIIMCNHSSLFDIPLSYTIFPNHSIRMLAKKELSQVPIFGKASKAAEFIFIDRHNRHKAIQDLKALGNLMQDGIVMWIYAEGTRSKDGKLQPLKKGGFITAIQTSATIIPVGIRGASSILPSKKLKINLGQKTEIHVGNPIDASQYKLENKEELIQKVYESMKELVNDNKMQNS